MQCPYCHTDIPADEVSCPSCGAIRITSASPSGVIVGWVGITLAVIVACLWSILVVLPLTDAKISDFPWLFALLGTTLALALLGYSRSTRKPRWIHR